MKNGTIPSLDGIRAISVLLVFFGHAGFGDVIPGGFGVTTFFFLSGYLITTLLLIEYNKNNTINFTHFFIRRFFRLFPALILTLCISYFLVFLGLLGGGISLEGLFSQVFYLANYHSVFHWPGSVPDGTGILWSLAVEEHFYLLFPFIFYLIIHHHDTKTSVGIFLLLCGLVLIWRYILVIHYSAGEWRTYYATDTRIDSILFGCILAVAYNPYFHPEAKEMSWKAYVLFFTGLSLLFISFLYRDPEFRETIRYTVQGLGLLPLFYLSIKHHNHLFFKLLNTPIMIKIGQYSYFMYLIHFVVLLSLKQNELVEGLVAYIFIALSIVLIYSYLVDRYFDVYFRRLRKSFR